MSACRIHLALALPKHNHAEHHAAENAGAQHNGDQQAQTGIQVECVLLLKVEANAMLITVTAATRTGYARVVVEALGQLHQITAKALQR